MAKRKRKSADQAQLDATLCDGIYQRPYGPHKKGPITTLESFERRAVSILDRFTEAEYPDADACYMPVCGQWRAYASANDAEFEQLSLLALAFWSFNDAFRHYDEMSASPSVEKAEQFASAVMLAVHFATELGLTTSTTWKHGEAVGKGRSRGGDGTRRIKDDDRSKFELALGKCGGMERIGTDGFLAAMALELFKHGITGRDPQKPMPTRTVDRYLIRYKIKPEASKSTSNGQR